MAPRTTKKPSPAASQPPAAPAPATPAAPSSAELLERTGEWLKTAGLRVEQLSQELLNRDERIAHLQVMLAEAEARRHEADLAYVTATADLLAAGERILELEAKLGIAAADGSK